MLNQPTVQAFTFITRCGGHRSKNRNYKHIRCK
jgi:hypothetical protein